MEEKKEYKSPKGKMIVFFEKSRNQWKEKCLSAKQKLEIFRNRINFLEKSKEYWKVQTKDMKKRISEMESTEKVLKDALAAIKKKFNRKEVVRRKYWKFQRKFTSS